MNNECIPLMEAAYTQRMTVHADTALTGKTFAASLAQRQSGGLGGLAADPLPAGDGSNLRVAGPAAAAGQVSGVVAWDAPAGGKAVIIRGAGTRLPVTSGGVIAVGNDLMTDAQGRVVLATAGNYIVGKAHSAAAGAGTDVEVELASSPTYAKV